MTQAKCPLTKNISMWFVEGDIGSPYTLTTRDLPALPLPGSKATERGTYPSGLIQKAGCRYNANRCTEHKADSPRNYVTKKRRPSEEDAKQIV